MLSCICLVCLVSDMDSAQNPTCVLLTCLLLLSDEVAREVFFEADEAAGRNSGTGVRHKSGATADAGKGTAAVPGRPGETDSSGSGAGAGVVGATLGLGGYGSGSESGDEDDKTADVRAAKAAKESPDQQPQQQAVSAADGQPAMPNSDRQALQHEQAHQVQEESAPQQQQQQAGVIDSLSPMDVDRQLAASDVKTAAPAAGGNDLLADGTGIDNTFSKGQT